MKNQKDKFLFNFSFTANIPVNIEGMIRSYDIELDKNADLPSGIHGQIERDASGQYKISIQKTDHYYRKRFTMAHELAHFLFHKEQIGDGVNDDRMYRSTNNKISPELEIEANKYAAAILMPDKSVLEYAIDRGVLSMQDGIIVEDALKELAIAFQVSTEAMKYKINKLKDKILA